MAIYGYNTIGGSTWDCEADYIGIDVTVAGGETATKLTFYGQQSNDTHTMKGAIYSGTTKVAETNAVNMAGVTSPAWYDLPFAAPPSLSAGTYRLVVGVLDQAGETADYFYDAPGGAQGFWQSNTYAGTMPGTLDLSADASTRKPSLYLTTSAGGSSPVLAAVPAAQRNRRSRGRYM